MNIGLPFYGWTPIQLHISVATSTQAVMLNMSHAERLKNYELASLLCDVRVGLSSKLKCDIIVYFVIRAVSRHTASHN